MGESKATSGANDGMRHLVDIMNQLQDIFSRLDNKKLSLSLPQIAVVGGQSSGKSSVLENVVGRDFLPRGSGIVTRCPLILQIQNREGEEYWQFEHMVDKKFTTAEEVRQEISKKTDEIAGSDKGVTSVAITLKFFTPNVPNLTLVDLPGLTQIPIEGQPADIAKQIRELVFEYVAKENVLILAITQANIDVATSDAIKVAKEANPELERTIGVLTKLDLVESEHEKTVRDVLDNKVVKLKHGFTGVINRSQKDIDEGRDIDFAYQKEKDYFTKKRWFNQIKGRLGTKHLQQVLNEKLSQHISRDMPRITADIKQHCDLASKKLLEYGDLGEEEAVLMKTLVQLVDRLKVALDRSLRGGGEVGQEDKTLSRGYELRKWMAKYRDKLYMIQFNEQTVKHQMYISMKNMQGIEPGIFPPDKAVMSVVKHYTDDFLLPVNEILAGIESSMMALISQLAEGFSGYPKLKEYSLRILRKNLRGCVKRTEKRVKQFSMEDNSYLDIESEHLQTAYKKLKRSSSSLLVSADGLCQEICSGVLKGSDTKLYNCKLTPAKLIFQRNTVGSSELHAEHDVPIFDYTYTVGPLSSTFELKFNKRVGGISYLHNSTEKDTVAAENATAWLTNLKDVFSSIETRKTTAETDQVDLDEQPPLHLKGQIDAMFEIFLSLMEVSKKKYSEHIRKIICYNTINCFQKFVDSQDFYGELVTVSGIKTMMGRSAKARLEIENLQDEVKACREGLEIIETMSTS
ncbi:Dynamin-1 [Halotydeus destructor]|nr:Dynamin-1 [Halotydeus destructor]